MNTLKVYQKLKISVLICFTFLRYNVLLLFLVGLFFYRTFLVGRLNYALLILLSSLFVIIICEVIYNYNRNVLIRYLYRVLIFTGISLLIVAVVIQLLRFAYIFTSTFTEVTLAKILVRVGILTANLYILGLIFTFVYYLYVHKMLAVVWNGSFYPILKSFPSGRSDTSWRRERIASLIFIYTLFWGGLATIITLGLGFIAWLLR